MTAPVHPAFANKLPPEARVWRYLTLPKIEHLFGTALLHFTRVDRFGDHFEGAWPKKDYEFWDDVKKRGGFDIAAYTDFQRPRTAASCWVGAEYESVAMWDLYAKGDSIAIVSTFAKLEELVVKMEDEAKSSGAIGLCGVGKVTYLDHSKDGLVVDGPLPNTFRPFMIKNHGFEHEREVRILVNAAIGYEIPEAGLDVPLDLATFIDEVIVSPYASDGFAAKIADTAKKGDLAAKVSPSSLDPRLFYRKR